MTEILGSLVQATESFEAERVLSILKCKLDRKGELGQQPFKTLCRRGLLTEKLSFPNPCNNLEKHFCYFNFSGRKSFWLNALGVVELLTGRENIGFNKHRVPSSHEALFDLESTNQELNSDLFINSASQYDVSGNRKAVVVHVPYRLRKAFRKIHVRLVRELEKKFSGKDVVMIATRRIVRPPKKGSAAVRPRSRTLTAVHEAILEDLVYPAEIVGKRVRYRLDGSKIMKIYLDPKERNNTEYKLETFGGVYRKLCGKDVVFEYPLSEAS